MKKLILFTISLVLLDAANAQSLVQRAIENAAKSEKETTAGQNLDAAIEAIKADITKSFDLMGGVPIPDSEKFKKFDKTLQELKLALDLLSKIENSLDENYNNIKTNLYQSQNKSTDKSLTQSQREFYKKQIPRFESAVERTNAKKIEIQKVRNEISTAKKQLEEAKLEFIDALTVDDLEWQNKCLENLRSSRELLEKTVKYIESI